MLQKVAKMTQESNAEVGLYIQMVDLLCQLEKRVLTKCQ